MNRRAKQTKPILAMVLGTLLFLSLITIGIMSYFQLLIQTENLELEKANIDLQAEKHQLSFEKDALSEQLTQEKKLSQSIREELSVMKAAEEERLRREEEAILAALAAQPKITIDEIEVGQVLDETDLPEDVTPFFAIYEIAEGDEIYERINGKSYRKNNHVALSDLRYLKVLHYNFHHKPQMGEIIVNVKIAEDVISIFRELYEAEYEIQSMYLVDNYWTGDGDSSDSASIDVNNTSAFNYRNATGSSNLSRHAYGMAIDLNPQQNPYLWKSGNRYKYAHDNAASFIDRKMDDPHIIVKGDICYEIFKKYGFSWGGEWTNPIDYQHFEKR